VSAAAGRIARVLPLSDALVPGGGGVVALAVVAEDPRLVDRVAAALRRDGTAAHVEPGGRSRLAVDRLERLPDVVILAGNAAPETTGEVRRIRRRLPEARIVLLVGGAPAPGGVRHVLDLGVDGIVVADAPG
jgi:hypothetical protein